MSDLTETKTETPQTDPWSAYTEGSGFGPAVEIALKRRVGTLEGKRILIHGYSPTWANGVCSRLGPPAQVFQTPLESVQRRLSNGWSNLFDGILCVGLPSALTEAQLKDLFRDFHRVAKTSSWLALLLINPRRVDPRFGTSEAPTQTITVPAEVGGVTLTTHCRGLNQLARCFIDPGFSMPTFDEIRSTEDAADALPKWSLLVSNG